MHAFNWSYVTVKILGDISLGHYCDQDICSVLRQNHLYSITLQMKKSFHDRLRHDILIAIQNEVGSGARGHG